jgi:hypothetical protein
MSDFATNQPASLAAAALEAACDPCPGCRRPLPIRAKRHGESAAHWECAACHAQFTGVLVKEAAVRMADAVRISQVHFDAAGVSAIPSMLRELVREFIACRQSNPAADERRAVPRLPAQLDVTVLPLDENWTPRPKPMLGMVIDLAPHGLGMVTSDSIGVEHVAVQFRHPAGLVQILGRVVWTKEIEQGFHNTGVQFLLRFGRSPILCELSQHAPAS